MAEFKAKGRCISHKDRPVVPGTSLCDICLPRNRNHKKLKRIRVLQHYGGYCRCPCGCGEARYEFLAIDHINGGGNAHRRAIGVKGSDMAGWLIKNGFPEGFRVLCHNCNAAWGFYKHCPGSTKAPQTGTTSATYAGGWTYE